MSSSVAINMIVENSSDQQIYWGWSPDELNAEYLVLYKTGRTNANDGGIDFVMKPLGRFFQVTETIDAGKYFLDIDFFPTVKTKVLEDKTIIPYWYKRPDLYLQKQLKSMIDLSLLPSLIKVIIIGGDHGGGKFRMSMKVNFRLAEKKTHSYLTQIASVSFSKDKLEILKETVLDPIGEGLQLVVSGGKFLVLDNDYNLQFSLSNISDRSVHCNCPVQVYLAGDLKFYAQISGRDDMSSFWGMWCKLHPNTWKTFNDSKDAVPDEEKPLWTVALHDEMLQKIQDGQLKTPKEKKGIVSKHIWSFIEPQNYIFPQLHFEIGVVNLVLDNFYEFIEDQVEILTPEEKVTRNNVIITEAALKEVKGRLDEWLGGNHHTLSML